MAHVVRSLALSCVAAVLALGAGPSRVQGEPRLKPKSATAAKTRPGGVRTTLVELEILTGDGIGLQAQQWRSTLESLEISVSIRGGLEEDEPETKEKILGTLRKVTAIGRLDRSGRLIFADREFAPSDRAKLKEWVNDLKTFGAQGKPDGQPLWGLNEDQFTAVFESLTEVTTVDLRDEELEVAVTKLPLPAQYPVRWSEGAKERLSRLRGKAPVRQSTEGFAAATALAIILRDYGLGFRPSRTPSGSVELVIDVPGAAEEVWPVGWPLKQARPKAAPKFFKLQPVYFEDVSLGEVVSKAAQEAQIPIFVDYSDPELQGDDWLTLTFDYPPRQATWHTVLRDSLNKAKLTFDLWQDEAGRAFLSISSNKSSLKTKQRGGANAN